MLNSSACFQSLRTQIWHAASGHIKPICSSIPAMSAHEVCYLKQQAQTMANVGPMPQQHPPLKRQGSKTGSAFSRLRSGALESHLLKRQYSRQKYLRQQHALRAKFKQAASCPVALAWITLIENAAVQRMSCIYRGIFHRLTQKSRMGKQQSSQRTAPKPTQPVRQGATRRHRHHGVRKGHRGIATIQNNVPHPCTLPPRHAQQGILIHKRRKHSLTYRHDVKQTATGLLPTTCERCALAQPTAIRPRSMGKRQVR